MSQHRFRFLGERLEAGRWVVRDAEEITHLTKVLRLKAGAEVEATDGRGHWCHGALTEVGGREAQVTATEEGFRPAAAQRIVVCLGALKHGAFDEILPGLVELGADAIHLFLQDGAEKTRLSPKALERWRRIEAQALKQCKRVHLPALETHDSLDALLKGLGGGGLARLVLAPGADEGLLPALGAAHSRPDGTGVALVVGAEQGLNPKELEALAAQGFKSVHCGDGILRAVTAALAATAAAALVRG